MKMNPISLFVLILVVQLQLSVVVLANNVPPKPATNKKASKNLRDILTEVARDATFLVGGPFWEVPFGRKDGRISINREANHLVP
ncbi:hypothetical protein Patl1_15034 [Pistacia atlantica]|uniref:Uncharacterized protein n=1 Tax=Pistacia atlantica TaxID=434234 RepID=A0ACC1B8J4_9ROSI|nr:hypothetical protein Patl1_15034 [Pistacia atlantica]